MTLDETPYSSKADKEMTRRCPLHRSLAAKHLRRPPGRRRERACLVFSRTDDEQRVWLDHDRVIYWADKCRTTNEVLYSSVRQLRQSSSELSGSGHPTCSTALSSTTTVSMSQGVESERGKSVAEDAPGVLQLRRQASAAVCSSL